MTPTDEINAWIAEHGSTRDALNVALARLAAEREAKQGALKAWGVAERFLREASEELAAARANGIAAARDAVAKQDNTYGYYYGTSIIDDAVAAIDALATGATDYDGRGE